MKLIRLKNIFWSEIAASLICIGATLHSAAGASADVRLGTLVPRGSSYSDALQEMGDKWRSATGGKSKLIIYPDGQQGGEADMVRKMRSGNLTAGLLTVVGLAEIDPSVSALQKMPLVFRSWEEIDYVRTRLEPELNRKLEAKGFVVLFWAEAGWVRFFASEPAIHPNDFQRLKMFVWKGDTTQVEIMKGVGYRPVELETADILPGLNTGMINAIPTIPFFALASQFDAKVPHMLDMKWVPLVGAGVIRKDAWEKFSPAEQKVMLQAAKVAGEKIRAAGRKEDQDSITAMQKRGLTVHTLTPEIQAEWEKLARTIYPKIRGGMVPEEMFEKVLSLLEQYRAQNKSAK
jgi:TRAP-type C4-dicarboxylate transport system substrate-binding protein